MTTDEQLPADYLQMLESLESSYLQSDDPIRQSGFGGGAERWRAEREPILDAIEDDGDLLDMGCANGYLLACLVGWGRERGFHLTPHGVDLGPRLIALAKQRLPQYAANFHVGNVWEWTSPRRYRYVYALHDCVPLDYLTTYVARLLSHVVAPDGRLIVGAYGSRSRQTPPLDIADFLQAAGYRVAGASAGGDPPLTRFAWVDTGSQQGRGRTHLHRGRSSW